MSSLTLRVMIDGFDVPQWLDEEDWRPEAAEERDAPRWKALPSLVFAVAMLVTVGALIYGLRIIAEFFNPWTLWGPP